MNFMQKKEKEGGISVVIRTKNEERWIGHTIQSVLELLNKPEIVVVDNNSSDQTISVVRHFQQDPELNSSESPQYTNIKIVEIDDYSPGKALNKGVLNCSNKYILVISSHCVLIKFNFEKQVRDLEEHVCIFGNQIPVWEGKKIKKR